MKEKTTTPAYLFEVGDIVRTTKGSVLVANADSGKWYTEHLRVVFRFWDGAQHAYVLDTGDDGICVISDERGIELEEKRVPAVHENPENVDGRDERGVELEEKRVPAVHENPENVDGRDKRLYLVRNVTGEFYVVAHSFDEAESLLAERLDQADYGFSSQRRVHSIDLVAAQHFFNGKQLFSGDIKNLVIIGDKA